MRYLRGEELSTARANVHRAADVAELALCLRAKCGAVIYNGSEWIGSGFNAPPRDDISQRRCDKEYDLPQKFKYDRTCCLHAEWRAIMDALRRGNAEKLEGSTLYFTRVSEEGRIIFSGRPYCTVCSRVARDVGISHFVLWHEEGIALYDIREYDDISYEYMQA